jgi:pyruvate formate lyase activating enzyme
MADAAAPGAAEDSLFMGEAELLGFLERRAGLISGLVISGGEPLLHEELSRFVGRVHDLGLAVKLDTNGSYPERLAALGADYVALDLKTSPDNYGRVAPLLGDAGARALASLAWLRSSGLPFELRITCAPGIVDEADIAALALVLEPGDAVVLQAFRPGGCLDPLWDDLAPLPEDRLLYFLSLLRAAAPGARLRGQPVLAPSAAKESR